MTAMQAEQGDFRYCSDADRYSGARPLAHIKILVALMIQAGPFFVHPFGGRPSAYLDLSGMGVPREHERDVGGGHYLPLPVRWVVAEENGEDIVGQTYYRIFQTANPGEGRPADILYPHDGYPFLSPVNEVVGIEQ